MANKTRKEIESLRRRHMTLFFMVGGLVFFYLIFSFMFGDMGLMKLLQMRETRGELQVQNQLLKQENERLQNEVVSLRNDPGRIESVAREKLGMAKKGEIIYQYERPDAGPKPEEASE